MVGRGGGFGAEHTLLGGESRGGWFSLFTQHLLRADSTILSLPGVYFGGRAAFHGSR